MFTVSIRFTAGQYHATPWGRHVNEGVPEWPPSPWRLLRALVATWKRTMPEVPEAIVRRSLAKLAQPPNFRLPRASLTHTRLYMPLFKQGKSSPVFDTFVALDRFQRVLVTWPDVSLDPAEASLLGQLLANLPYLGRAESWCQAELIQEADAGVGAEAAANCFPLPPWNEVPEGYDPVQVLAPVEDLRLEHLLVETNDLRLRQKRLDPPGARWLTYARSKDCFLPELTVSDAHRGTGGRGAGVAASAGDLPGLSRPVVVRYALDAKPLPPLTSTLLVGELARRAAMALYGRQQGGGVSPILAGKNPDGNPSRGHRHAFYLPADEDRDGRLDHLTIYAAAGFTEEEVDALSSLHQLNFGDGRPEVDLLLLGAGSLRDAARATILGPSRTWESVTPFLMSRHPKFFRSGAPKVNAEGVQVDSAPDQIRREWEQRRRDDPTLPALVGVEAAGPLLVHGRRVSWLDFRRWRKYAGGGGPGGGVGNGGGFRLTFAGDLAGPLALGYACHFGLGLFVPVANTAAEPAGGVSGMANAGAGPSP